MLINEDRRAAITNDGIADVLVRGAGIGAVWLPCLVLLGFAVVVGAAATRFFRWESQ